MRRSAWALLLLLSLAGRADAVGIKGQTSYRPYAPIVLSAVEATKGTQFLWEVSSVGATPADAAQVVESGAALYVWAPPGQYRVTLTAVDFEAKTVDRARFAFAVEGAPPVPPGPVPPGPEPTDPLYLSLKAAWAKETAADREAKRVALAAIYREAVKYANDPVDTTAGALVGRIKQAVDRLVGPAATVLTLVRQAAAVYMRANLPEDPATMLDAAVRARYAAAFTALASALEALR